MDVFIVTSSVGNESIDFKSRVKSFHPIDSSQVECYYNMTRVDSSLSSNHCEFFLFCDFLKIAIVSFNIVKVNKNFL